jgi:uncharacterized protein (UPF0332 family)
MIDKEKRELIAYRIMRANRSLQDAENLLHSGSFEGCINRLYYACFYTPSTLLISKNVSVKSHAGVKQMLGEHFIKSNEINLNLGKLYSALLNYRQDSDYLDFTEVSKEFAEELLEQSKNFIAVSVNWLIDHHYYYQQN